MNAEVITVATHKEGNFNNLINNNHNIKIKVLGMGQKWTGFKMKYELVYDYIKNLEDKKIIVFVDGFDTVINGNLEKAVKIFKKNKFKTLFSLDAGNNFLFILLSNLIFGYCRNPYVANTGLYMGYVKYLKEILKKMLSLKCKDDQVILNRMCKYYNYIEVDHKELIFKNIYLSKPKNKNNKNKQIFLGYPAQFNINRIYRAPLEYGQFVIFPILTILSIIIFILIRKKRKYTSIIILVFIIIYFNRMDKSCI